MDMASLVDVVQAHSDLQNAVEDPFGVEVLVFISKKTIRNPIPKVFPLELFHKNQLFPLRRFHLKSLSHMHMIPNIYPLLDFFFEQLLFLSTGDLLVGLVVEDRVLLAEDGVGGGVQAKEWVFLEEGAIGGLAAGLRLGYLFTEEVLFMLFFLDWELNCG